MASHKFEYPATGAVSNTLTWNTKARLMDDVQDLQFNDQVQTTLGGSDYVKEFGDDKDIFVFSGIVPKSHASLTDEADVLAFFAVVKRLNTFKWTDENGTERTVRNMTNPIRSENFSGVHRIFKLELKKQ